MKKSNYLILAMVFFNLCLSSAFGKENNVNNNNHDIPGESNPYFMIPYFNSGTFKLGFHDAAIYRGEKEFLITLQELTDPREGLGWYYTSYDRFAGPTFQKDPKDPGNIEKGQCWHFGDKSFNKIPYKDGPSLYKELELTNLRIVSDDKYVYVFGLKKENGAPYLYCIKYAVNANGELVHAAEMKKIRENPVEYDFKDGNGKYFYLEPFKMELKAGYTDVECDINAPYSVKLLPTAVDNEKRWVFTFAIKASTSNPGAHQGTIQIYNFRKDPDTGLPTEKEGSITIRENGQTRDTVVKFPGLERYSIWGEGDNASADKSDNDQNLGAGVYLYGVRIYSELGCSSDFFYTRKTVPDNQYTTAKIPLTARFMVGFAGAAKNRVYEKKPALYVFKVMSNGSIQNLDDNDNKVGYIFYNEGPMIFNSTYAAPYVFSSLDGYVHIYFPADSKRNEFGNYINNTKVKDELYRMNENIILKILYDTEQGKIVEGNIKVPDNFGNSNYPNMGAWVRLNGGKTYILIGDISFDFIRDNLQFDQGFQSHRAGSKPYWYAYYWTNGWKALETVGLTYDNNGGITGGAVYRINWSTNRINNDFKATFFVEPAVTNLEYKFIGTSVTDPTLIGYIEGAPPVPEVNLDENKKYSEISKIRIKATSADTRAMSTDRQMGPTWSVVSKTKTPFGGVNIKHVGEYMFLNKREVQAQLVTVDEKLKSLDFDKPREKHLPNFGTAYLKGTEAALYVVKSKEDNTVIGIVPVQKGEQKVNAVIFKLNDNYLKQGDLETYIKEDKLSFDADIEKQKKDYEYRFEDINPYGFTNNSDDFAEIKKLKLMNLKHDYQWLAQGSTRKETVSTSYFDQTSIGGSLKTDSKIGGMVGFKFLGYGTELSTSAGFKFNFTKTVNKSSSEKMEYDIDVKLDTPHYTDGNGQFTNPEKVYGYTFNTYCLQPTEKYYDEFFTKIVDQKWLYNPDIYKDDSLKLREIIGKRNAAWKILYRVTEIRKCKDARQYISDIANEKMSDEEVLNLALEKLQADSASITLQYMNIE